MSATAIETESAAPWSLITLPSYPYKGDITKDAVNQFAPDMALIHNVFIRGMNSLWINAPLVKSADERAFAGYALACLAAIHAHHQGEEDFIFPFLSTKINMNNNLEQHEGFHAGMDAFEGYMTQVLRKTEKFNADKTRELLKAFADPLVQHLHEEISTIQPESMSLLDEKGLASMIKELEEHVKSQPGKFTIFPFVVTHHDPREAPNWPPVPPLVKWFARNIAPIRHPSYWKFSPFTSGGIPQTYEA